MKYLSDCSLSATVHKLQNGEISPLQLIDELCDKLDSWDDKVRAFLPEPKRRNRLKQDLEELYKKFPDSAARPALFGIPIGVKDIFQVAGFTTNAGSNLPPEILQGEEAEVVKQLKKAGALIMGKTVTTEFAYFDPGPTGNPHNLNHTPGGSSSGSAAAVAAGFVPLALGTQTIGSISRPAAFCGTVGFKPSYGRISAEGVIPFSKSVDHIGFMTQDVEGAKLVASILCEKWRNEIEIPSRKPILGIPEGKYLDQASPEIQAAFNESVEKLKKNGYKIRYIPAFFDIDEINTAHKLLNASEFSEVHKEWYKLYKDRYHKASCDLIETGFKVSSEDLQKAAEGRFKLRSELEQLQKENEIDLWISPSAPTTATEGLSSTGNPIMNLPWTYAGLPTLAIPSGFINDLPYGIQYAAGFGEDELLFEFLKEMNHEMHEKARKGS